MARLNLVRLVVALGIVTVLLGSALVASQRSATAMATAANQFLASLTPEQRAKATFAFADEERLRWHFIPNEMFPRKGLMIKDMTEAQRALAHALLKTGLSQSGYLTVTSIMSLEDILKVIENSHEDGAQQGGVSLLRLRHAVGHRCRGAGASRGTTSSLRFAIVNGTVIASSPAFLGTNPAEVRDGERRACACWRRVRIPRERCSTRSTPRSERAAIINATTAPGDILTMNNNDIKPLDASGLAAVEALAEAARPADAGARCVRRRRWRPTSPASGWPR